LRQALKIPVTQTAISRSIRSILALPLHDCNSHTAYTRAVCYLLLFHSIISAVIVVSVHAIRRKQFSGITD